jgi:hypothetical protein
VRQTDVNHCVRNPCKWGGICLSTDAGPICQCRNIRYRGRHCEIGITGDRPVGGGVCFNRRGTDLPISQHPLQGPPLRDRYVTVLQDLTQDSATLSGWRRTKRSGEGKMITLYCPGIYCLRYRSFRDQPKFSVITGNFR